MKIPIETIIKIILGVKISRDNFNPRGLIATAIVIFFGIVVFGYADFFGIIDTILESAQQPWYSFVLARFTFLMVFVKIIALSLFTKKQNAIDRFIASFAVKLVGFVTIIIANMLSDSFVNMTEDPDTKTLIVLFPYLISLMIALVIRGIYAKNTFSAKKFFHVR